MKAWERCKSVSLIKEVRDTVKVLVIVVTEVDGAR